MRTGTCRSGRSQTSEGRRDRFHSRRPMVYYALQKNLRTVFADLFLCTFRKYVCSPVSPETPSYGRSHCTCIQISAFFNPSGLPKAGHHYISWKDESLQGIEGVGAGANNGTGWKQRYQSIWQPIRSIARGRIKKVIFQDVLRSIRGRLTK